MNVQDLSQVQTLEVLSLEPKDETKGQFLEWRKGI